EGALSLRVPPRELRRCRQPVREGGGGAFERGIRGGVFRECRGEGGKRHGAGAARFADALQGKITPFGTGSARGAAGMPPCGRAVFQKDRFCVKGLRARSCIIGEEGKEDAEHFRRDGP